VNLATSRGGPDNITVVLLAVPAYPAHKKRGRPSPWLVGGLLGFCLLLAVLLVLAILAFHVPLP